MRSSNNFDYLDKNFEGKYYAGGTLFMDKDNRDFEDKYCRIHGHNMAGGAMFGDLEKYLSPEFFEKNRTGVLLTPAYDYDVEVFASGVFDAYDSRIFTPGSAIPAEYIAENVPNLRRGSFPAHVIAFSTCLDDMTDNRIVVFCELINKRPHR